MRWLLLALLFACSEADSGTSADAGGVDAGRKTRTIDASCVPELASSAWSPKQYAVSLPELCTMLAADGGRGCPRTRADVIASFDCARRDDLIVTGRCDRDTFNDFTDFEKHWTFDGAGTLIGARVHAALRCGPAYYATPRDDAGCDQPVRHCPVCTHNPQHACPADVLARFPGGECTVMEGFRCPSCELSADFPATGTPCSPDCESCAGGTCWTVCTCHTDGVYRTSLGCTE